MTLFAEQKNDVGEIALFGVSDDIGRARAVAAHAHVERAVEAEREAALRRVELHRRDAEIEHDAIDGIGAGLARDSIQIGELIFDQGQTSLRRVDHAGTARDGGLVAVDPDYPAVRGGEDRARIPPCAESPVDIDAAIGDLEEIEHLGAKHGNMQFDVAGNPVRASWLRPTGAHGPARPEGGAARDAQWGMAGHHGASWASKLGGRARRRKPGQSHFQDPY